MVSSLPEAHFWDTTGNFCLVLKAGENDKQDIFQGLTENFVNMSFCYEAQKVIYTTQNKCQQVAAEWGGGFSQVVGGGCFVGRSHFAKRRYILSTKVGGSFCWKAFCVVSAACLESF